jgi:uncharacterized RDD family membrane protein YckC
MQSPPPPPPAMPPPPPPGGMVPPPPPGGMVPPPPGYAAPLVSAGQTSYAGFWIRVVARLVDTLIIGVPFAILFLIVAVAAGAAASGSSSSSNGTNGAAAAAFGGIFVLLYLILIVVTFGYWIYFWGSSGQTLGMRFLRLKVVDANTGGSIGYGRAAIRLLMSFVNSLACYIGWIWVAFDPRKQGWHDKVANSVVIRQ